MAPEKLDYIITATRLRAGAGLHHSNQMVEDLCQEAERLAERVRVLEVEASEFKELDERAHAEIGELQAELRVSQLRARSAEDIAGLSLPQAIQALRDS